MLKRSCIAIGLLIGTSYVGCGGAPGEATIAVPQVNPLDQAKQLLNNYAKGQPVTSEAAGFPKIVEDVRKVDPAKAEILEKGFADILAAPGGAADKAKELLGKL